MQYALRSPARKESVDFQGSHHLQQFFHRDPVVRSRVPLGVVREALLTPERRGHGASQAALLELDEVPGCEHEHAQGALVRGLYSEAEKLSPKAVEVNEIRRCRRVGICLSTLPMAYLHSFGFVESRKGAFLPSLTLTYSFMSAWRKRSWSSVLCVSGTSSTDEVPRHPPWPPRPWIAQVQLGRVVLSHLLQLVLVQVLVSEVVVVDLCLEGVEAHLHGVALLRLRLL